MAQATASTGTIGAARVSLHRAPKTRRHDGWIIAVFLAPALLVYGVFVLYPIAQSVAFSF